MKKLLLITLLISVSLSAQSYSGGAGTEASPYQINTVEDLIYLSTHSGDWDKHFIQTANISFNEDETQVDWDGDGTATWDAGDQPGFLPIGDGTTTFTGTYNGDGHTISNLFINRSTTDNVGLFGIISSATIRNLGLMNIDITARYRVGGLVGRPESSLIENCFTNGILYSSGDATSQAGGLAGSIYQTTIRNSFSTVDITADISRVGGLAGQTWGTESVGSLIENCYATGNVKGTTYVGGLVGLSDYSIIQNCYAYGDVARITGSTATNIGAFLGADNYSPGRSTINNCYAIGSVFYEGTSAPTDKGFAGRAVSNSSTIYTNNFFDNQVSNQTTATGATVATTANMKTQSTFTSAGWDFTDVWVMSSTVTFNSYPTLKWTNAYSVSPTGNNIASVTNLVWLSENSANWGGSYTQTADLNMWSSPSWDGNKGWTPIGDGTTNFTGRYDGQNHTIANLYINRSTTYYVGFWGSIWGDASTTEVQNLGLLNVNIIGQNNVGSLVGMNDNISTISNCYSTGSVSGAGFVGGLVGINLSSSTINNCYSTGSVSGTSYVGGLVGINTNSSTISNSYSTGSVTRSDGASTDFGGFCGYNTNSTIEYCYSIGSVNFGTAQGFVGGQGGTTNYYTNNFFDATTSGQTTGTGATAKTTAEMKTQSTFTNWDFLSIWEIFPGFYPRLQSNPDPALPVELTSFTAAATKDGIQLHWETATEANNYGFEIERCEKQEARSETWKKIGFVQGHGNSNSVKEYSFVDASTPLSASSISYRLKQIDNDGSFSYSNEIIVETLHATSLPTEYALYQNYPNPFNPSTTIKFGLPKESHVTLEVFNIIGEKITTLINGEMQAGIHNYQFSIDNYQLSSGIYIYKLTTEGFTSTKKFVLMK